MQAQDELKNTYWKLSLIGSRTHQREVPIDVKVTLHFDEMRAYGSGGCNRYFATYHRQSAQLRFEGIGATRMACFGVAMDVEQEYFTALQNVTGYEVRQGQLQLVDKENNVTLIFEREEQEA